MRASLAILAALTALVVPTAQAGYMQKSESGNDNDYGVIVNSGACHSHGNDGNGPFTIVNTPNGPLFLTPNGFDGWVGCTH